MQPQLVQDVAAVVQPGGLVLLQSDVLEVAEDMRNLFEQGASDVFVPADEHSPEGVLIEATPPPEVEGDGIDGEQEEEDVVEEEKWTSTWAARGWLKENPLGVPTERELHTLAQGKPVYRVLLRKL